MSRLFGLAFRFGLQTWGSRFIRDGRKAHRSANIDASCLVTSIYPFEGSHTGPRGGPAPCAPRWTAFRCSFALPAFDQLKNMRSAGCVALWLRFFARTWPFDLDFARSDGLRDAPNVEFCLHGLALGSILEPETLAFSIFIPPLTAFH